MMRFATRQGGLIRPAVQLPEPARFWIRFVPRPWEPPEVPWLDLAVGRLGLANRGKERALEPADLMQLAGSRLDDVLYLPPAPEPLAVARDELAAAHRARGTPVLVQGGPGQAPAGGGLVCDLLPILLERDLDRLRSIPAGAAAVWPLLPGLTDDPALWEQGCQALAAAGADCVQALTPTLSPADRRRLAEVWGGEGAFDALFHREPPSERAFARAAHRHGLAPFLRRPLPRPPLRGAANRRIAGNLALVAELWLRLGRPVEQGQVLYRAARWIDATSYDLEGLTREGNLGVLTPLDDLSRCLIAECAEAGEPALLSELLAEYVAPEEGSGEN